MLKIVMCLCRRKEWKRLLRRKDLDKVPISKFRNRYLCSRHFSDSAYMCPHLRHSTSRLNYNAKPSIWDFEIPKEEKRRRPPIMREFLEHAQCSSTQTTCRDADMGTETISTSSSSGRGIAEVHTCRSQNKDVDALRKKVIRLEKALRRSKLSLREYHE